MITSATGDVTDYIRSADGLFITKALPCGTDLQFHYDIDTEHRRSYLSRLVETTPSGLIRTTLTGKAYEDIDKDHVKEVILP